MPRSRAALSTRGRQVATSSRASENVHRSNSKSRASHKPAGRHPQARNVHFDQNSRIHPDDVGDGVSHQLLSEQRTAKTPSSSRNEGARSAKAAHRFKEPNQAHQFQRLSKVPVFSYSAKTVAPTPAEIEELNQDRTIIEMWEHLRVLAVSFAETYFNFNIKGPIERAFVTAPIQLISYVGCIAIGGPNGREGWQQLISTSQLRKALVYGVICRVVQEHVIASLCFGADEFLINILTDMEEAQVEEDGFYRAEQRANTINDLFTRQNLRRKHLNNSDIAVTRVALQLVKLLQPIRELDYLHIDNHQREGHSWAYFERLKAIVSYAQELNILIRRNGGVVYYFEPIFKDEEFDVHSMTCLNVKDMQSSCPFTSIDDDGNETVANDPFGDESDKALVRVVCSPGCVAYRKGGGDLGKRLLREDEDTPDYSLPPEIQSKRPKNEVNGRIITNKDGFRSKRIAKAVVALRWGKPQFSEQPQFRGDYVELKDINREIDGDSACVVM